ILEEAKTYDDSASSPTAKQLTQLRATLQSIVTTAEHVQGSIQNGDPAAVATLAPLLRYEQTIPAVANAIQAARDRVSDFIAYAKREAQDGRLEEADRFLGTLLEVTREPSVRTARDSVQATIESRRREARESESRRLADIGSEAE